MSKFLHYKLSTITFRAHLLTSEVTVSTFHSARLIKIHLADRSGLQTWTIHVESDVIPYRPPLGLYLLTVAAVDRLYTSQKLFKLCRGSVHIWLPKDVFIVIRLVGPEILYGRQFRWTLLRVRKGSVEECTLSCSIACLPIRVRVNPNDCKRDSFYKIEGLHQ